MESVRIWLNNLPLVCLATCLYLTRSFPSSSRRSLWILPRDITLLDPEVFFAMQIWLINLPLSYHFTLPPFITIFGSFFFCNYGPRPGQTDPLGCCPFISLEVNPEVLFPREVSVYICFTVFSLGSF